MDSPVDESLFQIKNSFLSLHNCFLCLSVFVSTVRRIVLIIDTSFPLFLVWFILSCFCFYFLFLLQIQAFGKVIAQLKKGKEEFMHNQAIVCQTK